MDNVVTAIASTFLIVSSPFFHLTRTNIKALMSLKFCRIRPMTYDLVAFRVWKNPHILIMGEML